MKKLFFLLIAALPLMQLAAQTQRETVHLHNGSVIKGEVIETTADRVKVKTGDGSIFVYDMTEVERITKEADGAAPTGNARGGHRGLDFLLDFGYALPTEGGKGLATAEIGLGKRFNKNFYFGIGTGAWVSVDGGKPLVPVTADFRAMFPVGRARVAPGGTFRLGYVFNTEDDKTFTVGSEWLKESYTVKMPNYFMLEIMPSVEIPLSSKVDFNVALGYMHLIPVGDGSDGMEGSGFFMSRVGFGFHKGAPKPKKPVLDRGFQWGMEGGIPNVPDFNAALVLSYKWNKNLSFGVGFGMESNTADHDDGSIDGNIAFTNRYGDLQNWHVGAENKLYLYKFFARGTWRFLDTRISPLVSCDLGAKWMANSSYYSASRGVYNIGGELAGLTDDYSYSSFFFTPSVGVSLRTASNLYLEAKVGYSCTAAIREVSETVEGSLDGYETTYDVSLPKRKLSSLFVSVGLTHTFRLGSGWGK